MGIRLEVRTNSREYFENPEGFRNSDDCAPVLRAFCDKHGIPYGDTFVSIAVLLEGRNLKQFGEGRTARKHKLVESYGNLVITLKQALLKEIEVVCAGDFQNTICNAVARTLCGEDIKEIISRITVLSTKSCDEKMAALEEAAKVRGAGYAEARIHRPLRKSDDIRF